MLVAATEAIDELPPVTIETSVKKSEKPKEDKPKEDKPKEKKPKEDKPKKAVKLIIEEDE